MSETPIKELFATMAAGGPADGLDVDRAIRVGRRRRRVRTLAPVASVAAVVVAMLGFLVLVSPRPAPPPVDGGTPSPRPTSASPSPASMVTGTARDWGEAVLRALPYRDQVSTSAGFARVTEAEAGGSGDELSRAFVVRAVLHYTQAGRTTGLLVTATALGGYAPSTGDPRQDVQAACRFVGSDCHDLRDTPSGPVIVGSDDRTTSTGVRAQDLVVYNIRPSGTLIKVYSFGGDVDALGEQVAWNGAPGMAGDLERLISTATSVPEPRLGDRNRVVHLASSTPTPVSTPTSDSRLVTVTTGQRLRIASGTSLTLTPGSVCLTVAGGSSTCERRDGLKENDVSVSIVPLAGGSHGFVVMGGDPLSDAEVASVVVTVNGRSRVATTVRLGAGDAHLAYYVVWSSGYSASAGATVEVFRHDGSLLAQKFVG